MEFRYTQISLFLTGLLQLTGTAAGIQNLDHTVRVGDSVSLSCENLIKDQPECSYTTWLFSDLKASVELITHGQIGRNAGAKSDRISVTADCSLLIKKVTVEDIGHYVCQQFTQSGRIVADAHVFLSLLTIDEIKKGDKVTLRCFVWTCDMIPHRVKWLFRGKDVSEYPQKVLKQSTLIYTGVTVQPDQHMYSSRNDSLQCEVSLYNKRQLFPFRLQSSGKPGENNNHDKSRTTVSENGDTPDIKECRWSSALDFLMLSLRVAELILITLITALLFRAQTRQRPRDYMNVGGDGEDGTVSYQNVGEFSASVQLH